jgi:hypothetical protein
MSISRSDFDQMVIAVGSAGAISLVVGMVVPGTTGGLLRIGGAGLGGTMAFLKGYEMATSPFDPTDPKRQRRGVGVSIIGATAFGLSMVFSLTSSNQVRSITTFASLMSGTLGLIIVAV